MSKKTPEALSKVDMLILEDYADSGNSKPIWCHLIRPDTVDLQTP